MSNSYTSDLASVKWPLLDYLGLVMEASLIKYPLNVSFYQSYSFRGPDYHG